MEHLSLIFVAFHMVQDSTNDLRSNIKCFDFDKFADSCVCMLGNSPGSSCMLLQQYIQSAMLDLTMRR